MKIVPDDWIEPGETKQTSPSPLDEEAGVAFLINRCTQYRAEPANDRYARFDGCIYSKRGFLVAQYEVKQIGGRNERIRQEYDDQILNYGKWCEALSIAQITRTEILFFFRYLLDPSGQYRVFPISRAVLAPNKYKVIHLNAVTASSSGPKVLIPKDEMTTVVFPRGANNLKTLLDKALQH